MNALDDTRLYTVTDHFKISRGKVYDLIRTGQLRSITIGRTRRFTHTAITHYINTLNGGLAS
jgi:excisionase family DNA binding protein